MYSFIPFILMILSLAVIAIIIARKFPQLSLLDVASLPEFQAEQKKRELFRKRAEKQTRALKERWREFVQPVVRKWKEIQLAFRIYVGKIERLILEERRKKKKSVKEKISEKQDLKVLLQEGDYALEQKDWQTAEQKYIAMIRLDAKNKDAYYGLGKVYQGQGQRKEAEETFKFLLQLNSKDDRVLTKLAELAEEKGNREEAIEYYQQSVLLDDTKASRFAKISELLQAIGQFDTALEAISQAVELEPDNPKYLDSLVEISIMGRHKRSAEEGWERLRMVNPENQKLAVLKDKIDQL